MYHTAFSVIHINALHALQQACKTSALIFNSHLHVALPSGFFLLRLPTRTLHTPVFTSIPVTYPVHLRLFDLTTRNLRRTNHENPHPAVSASPLQPRPWQAEMPSFATYAWTPLAYVLLWMCGAKINNKSEYQLILRSTTKLENLVLSVNRHYLSNISVSTVILLILCIVSLFTNSFNKNNCTVLLFCISVLIRFYMWNRNM